MNSFMVGDVKIWKDINVLKYYVSQSIGWLARCTTFITREKKIPGIRMKC